MLLRISLILLYFLPIACMGQGSGLQLTLISQRRAAMANAGTALPLDGATAWVNPAAMSFLDRRAYLQVGGSIYSSATSFLEAPPAFYFESMDTFSISPVYAYGVFRPRAYPRIALGMSINSPYAATSLWPDNWKGRFLTQEFRFNSLVFQPSLSYRLSQQTSIALGLSYGIVSLLSERAIDRDGPNETRSSVRFSGQGTTAGFSLGLYHIYSPKITFGMVLRSPMQVNIREGLATFDVPSSLIDEYPDQAFQTVITLPWKLNIGVGYRPESRLLVAFDVRYARWQSIDSLSFVLEGDVAGLQEFPQKAWENTLDFYGGLEYLVNERLEIRAGLSYDNSPVPDDLLSPELPDSDRIGIHGGVGFHFTRDLGANLSLGYNYAGERTGFLRTANFGGIYESVAYHFGD